MAEVTWTPSPDIDGATWAAISDQIMESAQQLRDETAGRAPGHNYADRLQVDVDDDAHRARVYTTWSFGHFLEWGSIRNVPTAPMSSAAADLFGGHWSPS